MNRARHGLHVLALTMAALFLASSAVAQSLHMPPHEKYVLKNGLTVLLLEKHGVPIINLYAIVKTGSTADPAGEDGLGSITAGLLRKGTKARSGAAICGGPGLHRRRRLMRRRARTSAA